VVHIPEGECLADVRDRASAGLQEILGRHDEEIVVLVGHQVVNKVLICTVLGLMDSAFWRIRQDMGCINWVDYDDEAFTLLTMNDVCHLKSHPPDVDRLPECCE
jgi:probable phosphoglycerate mutase